MTEWVKLAPMRERFGNPNYQQVVATEHADGSVSAALYDTTTASKLLQEWNDESIGNGPWYPGDAGEILFLNKWDQYFLYSYCEIGDPWDYERIKPMSKEQAILWATKVEFPAKTIIDVFGPLKEAGEP